MGKIDVAGGVDQVELVRLTVFRRVVQRDRVAFDRDASFSLDVHRIEHLVVKLTLSHTATRLNQPVRQGGLSVIDVGDDAKIADVFHGFVSCNAA